ncbi:MAG: TRAP transporter small permease [Ruminiclostridium sp.]|nr:TRAP transporter small permease [Ruminiclostridium sp.]
MSKSFDLTQSLAWKGLSEVIRWLMIACSVISTGCMVYSVVLRYVFKGNFYGSDEVIMLFAFWLYFMGAVYGSFENSHIKADLLNVYIKNMRKKDAVALLGQLLTIVVNTIVLVWAIRYFGAEIAKGGLSTALKIPLVIPKSAVFFGFLLMEFYHVVYFIKNTLTFVRKGYFSEPQDGDYVTDALKAKFPECSAPTKAEVMAAKAAEAAEIAEEEAGE